MGRQVRFYMLGPDRDAFFDYLFGNAEVVALHRTGLTASPHVIDDIKAHLIREPEVMALWNKNFPLFEHHFNKLSLDRYDEREARYVPTDKTVFAIDMFSAPVIEYTPCVMRNDGMLQGGRIWASLHSWKGGAYSYKGKDFERWYSKVSRWIKNHFERLPEIDAYVGPTALSWYRGSEAKLA